MVLRAQGLLRIGQTAGKKDDKGEAIKQADLVEKAKKMGEQVLARQRIEKRR